MDPDYGPSPDNESARKWLEEIVARRDQAEHIEDQESRVVTVRGFDNKLPDPEIEKAMANHFSCCGEIVEVEICPFYAPKSDPDRFVCLTILGEGVKEKAEQLNGSELGGCKLAVHFQQPTGISIDDLSVDDIHLAVSPDFRTHALYDYDPKWRETLLDYDPKWRETLQPGPPRRRLNREKDEERNESSLKKMKLSLEKKEYPAALNKLLERAALQRQHETRLLDLKAEGKKEESKQLEAAPLNKEREQQFAPNKDSK